jgi:hypothetical protein
MGNCLFPVGSRVRITSYTPFRGLRGTIRTVNTIDSEQEEPFCFYLVAVEGAMVTEPIWFEYDEVELIGSPSLALQQRTELIGVRS